MAREEAVIKFHIFENEKEELNAQLLQPQNIRFIENMLATDYIKQKNLKPDPNNYPLFVQEHAEVSGAIAAWEHLLNCHKSVIARLATD